MYKSTNVQLTALEYISHLHNLKSSEGHMTYKLADASRGIGAKRKNTRRSEKVIWIPYNRRGKVNLPGHRRKKCILTYTDY